ncbi:DnaJ C-terminal domain-containing protein [Marinivivus vitaminiproducens]|uniref:DnaJ C-terminal domain-containing protein n=1 Tax=Marinivivus vitaminiproducens TaxID=3035935 RepID=UPI00279E0667|nr:DnaJ C-terminal domain-containing protein [Geminicoccaceae bacterium SCSIO 64248]
MDDPYRVLNVGRDADQATIKKAYRKLAKEFHPDHNAGNAAAEKRFKEISAAYDILGDADKRARFDRGEIDAEGRERGPFGSGGFGGGFRQGRQQAGGFAESDIESVLNELFGGRFGGGRGRAGTDVRATLAIDFLDAALGGRQRVTLPGGRTVEVTVPAGAESSQVLRLKGQGESGFGGGPSGDMLIEISVRPHARYRREGLDIHVDQPVPLAVAIHGGRLAVPTIHGEVRVRVAPGTDSGQTLRLRGKGIVLSDGTKGDQLVRLSIALPRQLDAELKSWAAKQAEETATAE